MVEGLTIERTEECIIVENSLMIMVFLSWDILSFTTSPQTLMKIKQFVDIHVPYIKYDNNINKSVEALKLKW